MAHSVPVKCAPVSRRPQRAPSIAPRKRETSPSRSRSSSNRLFAHSVPVYLHTHRKHTTALHTAHLTPSPNLPKAHTWQLQSTVLRKSTRIEKHSSTPKNTVWALTGTSQWCRLGWTWARHRSVGSNEHNLPVALSTQHQCQHQLNLITFSVLKRGKSPGSHSTEGSQQLNSRTFEVSMSRRFGHRKTNTEPSKVKVGQMQTDKSCAAKQELASSTM